MAVASSAPVSSQNSCSTSCKQPENQTVTIKMLMSNKLTDRDTDRLVHLNFEMSFPDHVRWPLDSVYRRLIFSGMASLKQRNQARLPPEVNRFVYVKYIAMQKFWHVTRVLYQKSAVQDFARRAVRH